MLDMFTLGTVNMRFYRHF